MVIGKLKYLMELAVEHTLHCLVYGHTRVQGRALYPRAMGLFHARGKKGNIARVTLGVTT
jgi:hypothetical protein